ncbi:MAG: tetratricopeptide repeat protein [Clostridia bacterium]|nr:tetratricopeptide repeat protein [Clostridia bacterium]
MNEKVVLSDSVGEGYYFENFTEFALYVKVNKPKTEVVYLSGNNYKDMFMSGIELFEQKKFEKAIETLNECLKLNPVGISARFELVECYICTKQFELAKKTLLDMKEYLESHTNKARFYRRLGFISIEEKDYKTAYCCYKYSLNYENHYTVPQELKYIKSSSNSSFLFVSIKNTLKNKSIPLL